MHFNYVMCYLVEWTCPNKHQCHNTGEYLPSPIILSDSQDYIVNCADDRLFQNVTAGHWNNCILAHGHIFLSFDHKVLVLPLLWRTPGGVWFLLQSEVEKQHQHSETIHHERDIFRRFQDDLIVLYFTVFMSVLNHITLCILSIPWQKQEVVKVSAKNTLKICQGRNLLVMGLCLLCWAWGQQRVKESDSLREEAAAESGGSSPDSPTLLFQTAVGWRGGLEGSFMILLTLVIRHLVQVSWMEERGLNNGLCWLHYPFHYSSCRKLHLASSGVMRPTGVM